MEGEAAVLAEVQSGVHAGDERVIAQVLGKNREAKIAAAKPKVEKKSEIPKPEAKTEPQGQPEQKAEEAEPKVPTASSEKEQPESEAAAPEKPEAVTAVKAETKPEEVKEPPRIKVAFDGKEEEITLDEARSGYMRSKDYTLKTQELAKERETFSSETSQKRQVIDTTLSELGVIAQHMVQRLVDQDQRTDWNQLKQSDPESYAVKIAERTESRELLRIALAKATQIRQQQQQELTEKQKADFEVRKKSEEGKLALVIPEWSDPEKAKGEKAELAKYLQERGFTKDEIESLADHRFVALSREAMLYKRIQEAKKKAETEKKVEAKTVASPASSAPESGSSSRLERLQSKFQKSGGSDLSLAAKLLAERRKANRR